MRCEKIETGNLASSENNEQNKYFIKEIEALKKKILKMKNSIKRDQEWTTSIENRANQMEKWIGDIEDRNIEMMKREKETRALKKIKEFSENYLTP